MQCNNDTSNDKTTIVTAITRTLVYELRDCGDSIAFNRPCVAHQICRGVGKAYNQMNGGSANGDAFVNWRTKCTGVLNHYIYIPSLRARACACNPTTFVPPREVLVPSTRDSQNSKNSFIYMPYCVNKSLLINCICELQLTSKSCPHDLSSRLIIALKTHFLSDLN